MSPQTGGSRRGGRDGGGQDKSLQNVDWTTARLVTSVTGHRLHSGKYDLNVIKQFFVPYLLKPSKQEDNDACNDEDEEEEEEEDDDDDGDETRFVIKRQNTFMCFSTKKTKISRHHQLPSAWVQLRQVSEGVRLRVAERSFSHTSTWTVSGNWRIVLYLLKKRSTVDSRTKAYPTKTTLAVRQCGVTTG